MIKMKKTLSTISLLTLLFSMMISITSAAAEELPQNSLSPMPYYPSQPDTVSKDSPDSLRASLKILVYSSDFDLAAPDRYPVQALDNLGLPYTYVANDATAFLHLLTSYDWCMVVIDEPSNTNDAWDALYDYVASGGCLIYSTWYMFDMPDHPLWAAMGVSFVNYFDLPKDVYQWDTYHPIFNDPNPLPNPMTGFSNDWHIDGEIVSTVGDGTAIGGATPSPSADILLVVANGGKTVFNGFLFAEMDGDSDTDGKPDAVELIENEVMFVLGMCMPTPPTPVGGEIIPTDFLATTAPWIIAGLAVLAIGLRINSNKRIH